VKGRFGTTVPRGRASSARGILEIDVSRSNMQWLRAVALGLIWTVVAGPRAGVVLAVEASSRAAALQSITTEEVQKYVDALADDTFEGREAGSRGGRAAATYIVQNLKRFGFHGGGPKGSFFQDFREFHNILTLVEGRDPALKDQVVLISAHYDHVGYGSASNSFGPLGAIHNGADDNASGVAALLEVAEAVSRLAEPTGRSILIAFWDGEEKGLLGSEHWATHPTVPLERVSIMVNADMVGRLRNDRVEVYGSRTSAGLRRLVSSQNDVPGLTLDFTWQMKPDSDHHTFFSRNVPVVMLHTGLHRDYHRPSDDADKINADGLKQVAQLMFGVLVELAEEPAVGGFRRQSRQESRADQERREVGLPTPPGRLGIRWNDDIVAKTGEIVVSSVHTGTAAERAGFRRGDRVLSFAEREVRGAAAFRLMVLSAPAATTATVEREGESQPIDLAVELPGEPARLGVSWRTDDAEPGAVIVNRVTVGSPAGLAGLRVNDRIYRVNGQDFADAEGLRRLVNSGEGPLMLDVESHGRVRTVEISSVEAEIARLQAEVPNRGTDDASR
jgi:membrane-associated protease RseP (regulator of RpoE activity)